MNTLDFLNQTYAWLRRQGLVTTKADFSANMLGKARSYLTSMSARDRHPPLQVISHLRVVLQQRADAFRANPHFAQPYAQTLNLAHERLQEISKIVIACEAAGGRVECNHEVDNATSSLRSTAAQTSVFEWLKSATAKRNARK